MIKGIVCPTCKKPDGLIVYPKAPILLHGHVHQGKGQPIVNAKTDAACLECYWQGTIGDLVSITSTSIVYHIAQRVNTVLDAPFGDKEDEE